MFDFAARRHGVSGQSMANWRDRFVESGKITGAAFVTALCLLPLHRALTGLVGRFVDRERHVMLARIRTFVRSVRDGASEPEAVQDVLRGVLADPALRLLLRRPGTALSGYVDLRGRPADITDDLPQMSLTTSGDHVPTSYADTGITALPPPR